MSVLVFVFVPVIVKLISEISSILWGVDIVETELLLADVLDNERLELFVLFSFRFESRCAVRRRIVDRDGRARRT